MDLRNNGQSDARSVSDLIGELRDEVFLLARQEIELAKAETLEKVKKLARHMLVVAVGGLLLYAGLYFVLFAITAYLGISIGAQEGVIMAYWLPPLVVGLVVCVAGFVGVRLGMKKLKADEITPKQAIKSTQESAQWIANQVRT